MPILTPSPEASKTIRIGGKLLSLSPALIMGILNVTPDSFFDGGKHDETGKAVYKGLALWEEGADIIDLGGYSSRPGATDISPEEEASRVIPVIAQLKTEKPEMVISIDTFRASVAEKALQAGADMINDISGGQLDDRMFDLLAEAKVPYIMMHMKGTPQTMASLIHYDDLLDEIISYFNAKINILRAKGVHDIIIDPGFGFAKTLEQNYELLRHLNELKMLEVPMLVGVSRKSMIWKKLGISAKEALNGTTVLNTIALEKGANILRVHDVKEAREIVKLLY